MRAADLREERNASQPLSPEDQHDRLYRLIMELLHRRVVQHRHQRVDRYGLVKVLIGCRRRVHQKGDVCHPWPG